MKLSSTFTTLLAIISWGVSVQAAPGLFRRQADAQTSLTLDPGVIQDGLGDDGAAGADPGTAPSLTTTNNFINFCLQFTDANGKQGALTNGQQVKGGSCNPTPMGTIPSNANIPSGKLTSPANLQNFPANKAFTVNMKISNMETGFFTNADTHFLGAPQQLNEEGQIQGHSHITIQKVNGIQDDAIPDVGSFVFFKGLNDKDNNGVLTTSVDKGLPAGTYRCCTIHTSANHTPVIAPIAQHGMIDDCTTFTVGDADAKAAAAIVNAATGGANNAAAAAPAASDAAAAPPAASDAAATSTASAAASSDTAAASANNAAAAGGAAKDDAAAPPAAANNAAAAGGAKSFTLKNGQDAQKLNAKFATLTADSSCTEGDQGCIDGGFAQCVGGKFQSTGCAGGTKCFALPLVNSAGTSVTCDTEADATARIAATGATGGITGSG